MSDTATVVIETVQSLAKRRTGTDQEVRLDSDLFDDLSLESLDLAELSAVLEDAFGRDPYSAGLLPRTAGEVIAFYDT